VSSEFVADKREEGCGWHPWKWACYVGPFNTWTKWSQMDRDVIRQKSDYKFLVLRLSTAFLKELVAKTGLW
jgi:hypothetical protein